jgi:hypothetical protein
MQAVFLESDGLILEYKHRWKDNIKSNPTEMGCEGLDGKRVNKLWGSIKKGEFGTRYSVLFFMKSFFHRITYTEHITFSCIDQPPLIPTTYVDHTMSFWKGAKEMIQ